MKKLAYIFATVLLITQANQAIVAVCPENWNQDQETQLEILRKNAVASVQCARSAEEVRIAAEVRRLYFAKLKERIEYQTRNEIIEKFKKAGEKMGEVLKNDIGYMEHMRIKSPAERVAVNIWDPRLHPQ